MVHRSMLQSVPKTWMWSSLNNVGAHRKIIGAPRRRKSDGELGEYCPVSATRTPQQIPFLVLATASRLTNLHLVCHSNDLLHKMA